ncbi:hypothetical protein [Rhodococcus koreensis]
MYINISTGGSFVTLEGPDDCTRLSIRAEQRINGYDLATALVLSGAGSLLDDGDHVLVDTGWLARQANGRVGADWNARFSGMIAYADKHGWVEGEAVRAHIERI